MATLYDTLMRGTEAACLAEWRRSLLIDVTGDVLELGAGTGANLGLYGPNVQRLVMLEPDRHMRHRLVAKINDSPVEVVDSPSETLPFDDATFDTVVSTLVLCTVSDPAQALKEAHRVLKPGGQLVFLEHVAAHNNPGRLKWQRRLEPLWKILAGGCHITRNTAQLIEDAGFATEKISHASMRKAPAIVRPTIRGGARRPGN